jgi:hypothetical protein
MRIVVSIIAASLLSGCAYTSQVAPDTVEKANAHLDRVEKDRKPQWSEDEKKRLAGLFSDNPEYVALALHDDVEDSVTIPRLRTSVPPKYPFGLWVTDTKALVKVAFIISAAGLVEDARICFPAFRAIAAARLWAGTRPLFGVVSDEESAYGAWRPEHPRRRKYQCCAYQHV